MKPQLHAIPISRVAQLMADGQLLTEFRGNFVSCSRTSTRYLFWAP
jgi:hypothetical protein